MGLLQITGVLIVLVAFAYLAWWGRRFLHAARAKQLAASAQRLTEWPPTLIESLLEYGRLLAPASADLANVCKGLAERNVEDPRARTLFQRYLAAQGIHADNATVARRLAQLIPSHPILEHRRTDVSIATGLLDRLIQDGLADDADLCLRAEFARLWVDVSPTAIDRAARAWRLLHGSPEAEPLTRFLYNFFAAAWDTRGERVLGDGSDAVHAHNEFIRCAARVFAAMADIPPANLEARRLAIQAAFESGDYRACFEQCELCRDEFGAPALGDEVWLMWGHSIVKLEDRNWRAFAARQFTGLPGAPSWERLREILDRAASAAPDDRSLLEAQVWTYVGAGVPIAQALPLYERAEREGVLVVPALEQMTDYYHRTGSWRALERSCRNLLPLQSGDAATRTAHRLAEAIIEGNLTPDIAIFERVFDSDSAYAALHPRLAHHYLAKPTLDLSELQRIDRLLSVVTPRDLDSRDLQALRERFALAWLDRGQALPESLKAHVSRYLEAGGSNLRLARWATDSGMADATQRVVLLETLVRQRPVQRRDVLELAECYSVGATDEQMVLLAEAAESHWESRPQFDSDDCRVALLIGSRKPLSLRTRRKLLTALLGHKPAGWREATDRYLSAMLGAEEGDAEILQMVLSQRFAPDEGDPLHVWALEVLSGGRNEPVADGLRLLYLYDRGIGRPGDTPESISSKAEALAERLGRRCRNAGPQLRTTLFPPLFRRIASKEITSLARWEVDLAVFGFRKEMVSPDAGTIHFATQLAGLLAARGDVRAVEVQRWAYEHGDHGADAAACLFEIASRLEQTRLGDPYWYRVALVARGQADTAELALTFLTDYLLAERTWDESLIKTARDLIQSPQRQRLAPAFIERVEYGHSRQDDHVLVQLADEQPSLASGHARLLLALAERRERQRRVDAALEAYLLLEDSVGGSEDLARRILNLLPNSAHRAMHADRLKDYLQRYRNSLDLLSQMVTLARDPTRPLPIELAYAIVDVWGDQASRPEAQQAGYAVDVSFVVTTKCEVYDLYREQMTPPDAQALLRSIGKHSRQALSQEARRRVERIGDEVLFSSGQDPMTRQIVAEILYGLGNLSAATWHFEQLANVPEYHGAAVQSLERIARQLESPQRELPALLAAYRYIAEDAHNAGRVDVAEATVKKAKAILLDAAALSDLTEDDRKRTMAQRDAILKLYQTMLESRRERQMLTVEQTRDLADVYRLRGLWDKAGKLYSDLALSLGRDGNRSSALECAELVFDCYYKAGKAWWDPAARYLLRILWGRETLPPADIADKFGPHERRLLEDVAVMYHSLCVDPALHLDLAKRNQYKRYASTLYERLPLEYIQEHEYLRRLSYDLGQSAPKITEPFDLVPHILEHGRTEIWTSTRYEKMDRLGGGEFADVFKVRDTESNKLYAMKLITPAKGRDPKALERFQREGAWLKELEHPNIVKCYDAGVQEDRQFIIMDYVDGQTLDDLIARRRRDIPLRQRLRIFLDVCGAVEYLHQHGLLHRDLHPGNVLVGGRDFEIVKLTDFGLATMMDREGVGKSSRIHGRENYTSPEVYAGRGETRASDIYSLGAILCFVLSGWPHPDAALLRELKSPAYFELGEVVERALSNEPAARPQHVTALIEEVRKRADMSYDYGVLLQKVTQLTFSRMFELQEPIGHGHAGIVYRARDLRGLGAPEVAIKEITADQVRGSLERRAEHFYRVRDLSHPNVVGLHSFFRVDGRLYVVMDLVEGRSLADLMETNETQGRRFPPEDSLRTLADVARGLAFVHDHGIVHGCLVPTNVLVEAATQQAKVSDFAAATLFDSDQWHKSALVRQYNYYLAPEVTQGGRVTSASDVYSMGWMLCQMVTGQRGQLSSSEIYAALSEMGRWSDFQMERIVEIIENSTMLDPERRAYRNAAAFLAELERVKHNRFSPR